MPRRFHLVLAVLAMTATACGASGLASSTPRPGSVSPAASSSTHSSLPELYGNGFDRHPHANAELTAALAGAAADKRPILLDLGADWCLYCTVIENEFHTNRVRTVLSGYHVVTVDVGKFTRNLDMARRYGLNVKSTGIPALIVLSPDGKRKAEIDGSAFPDDPAIPLEGLITFLKNQS